MMYGKWGWLAIFRYSIYSKFWGWWVNPTNISSDQPMIDDARPGLQCGFGSGLAVSNGDDPRILSMKTTELLHVMVDLVDL